MYENLQLPAVKCNVKFSKHFCAHFLHHVQTIYMVKFREFYKNVFLQYLYHFELEAQKFVNMYLYVLFSLLQIFPIEPSFFFTKFRLQPLDCRFKYWHDIKNNPSL